MTKFLHSKPSQILSIFVLFTLLSSIFAFPVYALSPATSGSASSSSHQVQTPSWLTTLLKDHEASASRAIPAPGKGAQPMDINLGKVSSIKDQTSDGLLYYSPSEIRSAYNSTSLLSSGYNGTGEVISIVDAFGDPYIQTELNDFSATFGIPTTTVHVICVDGPCYYPNGITYGWNGEIALDVEWSHAMAPGATINLYIGSTNAQPLYDAVAAAVAGTNGTSPYSPSSIISMSWGQPENDFGESGSVAPVFGENYPWLNEVFQQGTAEGITFFASTGDFGAYDQSLGQTSPYGGASYPSTDPFVTAVGGTSLYLSTTTGFLQFPASNATSSYGYETAWSWNEYYGWGTGGGFSTIFGQPSWQTGPGVPSGETRGVPDVSWDADPLTGVLVDIYGATYVIGGTSVGSPSWAGTMALIDQFAGHNLGLVTPAIYAILNDPTEYAKAFHDVTVGNNDPLQAGPGWDPVTGVGTPNIGELAHFLAQPSNSLKVVASNNVALGTSASYTSVQITAKVSNATGYVTAGTVSAEITSVNGSVIGNVAMTYNGTMWTGTYDIKPNDPPGMWTATVHATTLTQTGTGTTTFSVGDGITIFASWGDFEVTQTIPIAAVVTEPDSTSSTAPLVVTSGSFTATFYLGTPSGPVQGTVPLTYNGTMWVGSFTILPSVTQGSWVLSISGTDSAGNRAAVAYSFVFIGLTAPILTLNPQTFAPVPDYVLGQTMYIYSYPYHGSYAPSTGSFSATVYNNGVAIGVVPLSYNATIGLWTGTFDTTGQQAGFYRIVVTGNDGSGNYAYGENQVRVAPYTLNVVTGTTVLSATTELLSAKVTYPNGTSMKVGSVDAFTSLGTYAVMTYNAAYGKFVGLAPTAQAAHGVYAIEVTAYDPLGSTGTSIIQVVSQTLVGCASNPVLGEASATCSADVYGYMPSGTVSWSQVAGPGTVTFPATCTLLPINVSLSACSVTLTGTKLGSVTLEAAYGGDSYNLLSSGTVATSVSTVGVSCHPITVVVGGRVTCTAKVVPYPPSTSTPTGSIAWSVIGQGTISPVSCKLSKGSCKMTFTSTAAGTFTIYASYTGNQPSESGSSILYVYKQASRTTVSCSPTSETVGSSKTITCTARVTGYMPAGTVYWSYTGKGNVSLSSYVCTLNSMDRCSVSMTATGAGTDFISATYVGNGNNFASFGTASLTINQAKTSLSLSCTSTSAKTWTCAATLKNYYGSVVGESITWAQTKGPGTVTFSLSTCSLSSSGTCSVTVTGIAAGKATIKASYFGDTNNTPSSKTKTLTVP